MQRFLGAKEAIFKRTITEQQKKLGFMSFKWNFWYPRLIFRALQRKRCSFSPLKAFSAFLKANSCFWVIYSISTKKMASLVLESRFFKISKGKTILFGRWVQFRSFQKKKVKFLKEKVAFLVLGTHFWSFEKKTILFCSLWKL